MSRNKSQSIKGSQNLMAGRDINFWGLNTLSEEIQFRLKKIEDRINSHFPQRFVSPSRNYTKVSFSCDRLLESLLFVGIPLYASIAIVEQIERHLVGSDEEEPTTNHIRQAVVQSIYALDPTLFGSAHIQDWGDRYARQYGNPDFRTKVLERDGTEKDLSHRFLKTEFLPHLIEESLGVSYARFKTRIIPRAQLDAMAKTIIDYVRTMNFYQIRYKTLFHLAYDLAVQPPHPWFTVEATINDIVDYDLDRARAHAQRLKNQNIQMPPSKTSRSVLDRSRTHSQLLKGPIASQSTQMAFHSVGECLHHASSAILAVYGNFIGCGYLAPLTNLMNFLKMFQFREESILLEFCDFRQIEGDLEAIGLTVGQLLRRLSLAKEKFHEVSTTFSEKDYISLKKDAFFLLRVADELVKARRGYSQVDIESVISEPKRLLSFTKDVFIRIPGCQLPKSDTGFLGGEWVFYIQHEINNVFFHSLRSPFFLVAVLPRDSSVIGGIIKQFLSLIQQDSLVNVAIAIAADTETRDVVKRRLRMQKQDQMRNLICVSAAKDLINMYYAKDRKEALESFLLRTRLDA
ncbi:MAG: hypothetical protein D6732_01540 [Methanobacteriota archaeon]|nr:MAG: hypothetical protein D6732_01540 [Euryarchaeota archaeon]